jgi:hypothetical protein
MFVCACGPCPAAVGGGGITTAMMLKGSATVKGKKGAYCTCTAESSAHFRITWHAMMSNGLPYLSHPIFLFWN